VYLSLKLKTGYIKSYNMKKLIFCCLVVLMGSCKDKNEIEPDIDFAPGFAATYGTNTADGTSGGAEHIWNVTAISKNLLGIGYTKTVKVINSGVSISIKQTYDLVNVEVNSLDSFTINEEATVTQTVAGTQGSITFKQKVEGVATRVINPAGVQQLNITLKLTNSSTGATTTEYLEFKKK